MTAPQILPETVILASGGGRGITARSVVRLAREFHCKFILLGRSQITADPYPGLENLTEENELRLGILDALKRSGEKKTPGEVQALVRSVLSSREISQTLARIRSFGGDARYVVADVTDAQAVASGVAAAEAELGKVSGILHGAGAIADKLVENKTAADFEKVFSAKVNGLENLLACVDQDNLKFLVLFSSIVGFYGNPGQSDYAMANEVLNKRALLFKNSHPDCRVLSIGWGPWDGGMVTPGLKKAFEAHHVQVIDSDQGTELLLQQLTSPQDPGVHLLVGDAPPVLNSEPDLKLHDFEIRRVLTLDSNPFLVDHRIGPNPVLPATCAATWAASVCEQLNPEHTFVSITNYRVLKGIVFDGSQADEFTLSLHETRKTPEGEIDYEALIWSSNPAGKQIFNYKLNLQLALNPPAAPVLPLPDLTSMQMELDGEQLYHNGTLFHGPAFQGVEKVYIRSREEVILRVTLPRVAENLQGQFPVQTGNPFVFDAIVQSLLIWAQQYYQAPCLPSSMVKLEQYRAVPFDLPMLATLRIVTSTPTSVTGDILVQALNGETLVKITGLQGTISPLLNRLIGVHS